MPEVVVAAARQVVRDDARHRTVSTVTVNGTTRRVYFDTGPEVPFVREARGDAFVAAALVVAMARGADLVMEDPISSDRLDDLAAAQDILVAWYPGTLRRAAVIADTVDVAQAPQARGWRQRGAAVEPVAGRTGACFTGGVDSFYSLIKNESRIDALIFGVGLDIPRSKVDHVARVREMLVRVGDAVGKPVLMADTNVRKLVGPAVNWGAVGHGPALASLATVFSSVVGRVLIPATHSYAAHVPWGSHPLLDPRWSTRRLAIEHDGAEATRCDKIRFIADSPVVHQNLRVCYRRFSSLNCGRCMKCLRTMMALHLVDRLEDCSTFARPLDFELFSRVQMKKSNFGTQIQIEELAAMADSVGGHDEARRAIATLSERHRALLTAQGASRLPQAEGTRPQRI